MRRLTAALILIGLACSLALPARAQTNEAGNPEDISNAVLGQNPSRDLAYGAFQRGQYLTAMALALDRVELDRTDGAAQTLIGYIYENGLGVGTNIPEAASWYQLGAANGDANAAFQLGVLLQNGVGIPQDRVRAADYFEQAANDGHAAATYNLALLFLEGVHRPPSLTRALELMKMAADQAIPAARYDYGSMLLQGAGTAPNTGEGARQIGLAARQGHVDAMVDYATLLYLGQGVSQDRLAATQFYQQAAEAGNAVAQVRYAKLLSVGENVELDLETAAMWRALARRQGLIDPALDQMLEGLDTEGLQRAEERALYWPALVPTGNTTPDILPAANDEATRAAVQALLDQGLVDEALMLPFDEAGELAPALSDGQEPEQPAETAPNP